MEVHDKNIALLIDAENISPKYVGLIIDEANKFGKINYRRIYGDWTTDQLKSWKSEAIEYGLTPVQQYSYTVGKNSSDFTLVIDAMDILYKGKVDSFCIVSSDSDFTRLVTRLKEDNMFVFGMGESKTPISLVNSCETFSYIDKIFSSDIPEETDVKKTENDLKVKKTTTKSVSNITPIDTIIVGLKNIIKSCINDEGWAYWGEVAQLFQKKFPGFHPRNYDGNNSKTTLIFLKKYKDFEFQQINTSMYVRVK